jgi:hypothetical protein
MNCKYCNNILKTKQSLKIHQKKVKYCLKIQKKTKTQVNRIKTKKMWKALIIIALSFKNEEIIKSC